MDTQNKKLEMNKDGDFIYSNEDSENFPPPMTQPKTVKVKKYCYYCGEPAKSIDTVLNVCVCNNCS